MQGGDCGGGFRCRACGEVDFGIGAVEDLGEFLAYAAGGAGDDEDLECVLDGLLRRWMWGGLRGDGVVGRAWR